MKSYNELPKCPVELARRRLARVIAMTTIAINRRPVDFDGLQSDNPDFTDRYYEMDLQEAILDGSAEDVDRMFDISDSSHVNIEWAQRLNGISTDGIRINDNLFNSEKTFDQMYLMALNDALGNLSASVGTYPDNLSDDEIDGIASVIVFHALSTAHQTWILLSSTFAKGRKVTDEHLATAIGQNSGKSFNRWYGLQVGKDFIQQDWPKLKKSWPALDEVYKGPESDG